MLGLNQDFPLLLSSVLEHGAANFGGVPVVSVNRAEHVRLNDRAAAARARRLASGPRRPGFGPDGMAGSLAWKTHRHFELFYGLTGLGAVPHTANPRLPPESICYTINIVLPRAPVSSDDLRAHLADLVPKWWLPDSIAFVDALPHGPTGKLAKNVPRDWIEQGRLTP